MATLNYSLMVKDADLRHKTRKRQKAKTILSFLGLGLAFLMLIPQTLDNNDGMVMAILSLVFLVLFSAFEGYGLYFHIKLRGILKNQEFDRSDPVEKAMDEMVEEYLKIYSKIARLVLVLIFAAILIVVTCIVLAVIDGLDVDGFAIIMAILVFLSIIGGAIVIIVMQMRLSARVVSQSQIIETHINKADNLSEKQITRQNNILLNLTAAQKVLFYQFPDERLRNKQSKSTGIVMIPSVLGGIILGSGASWWGSNPMLAVILVSIAIALIWGGIIALIVYQLGLRKEQRKLLEKDPEGNKLFLEYSDKTKVYSDRMNKVSLIIGIIVAIISWTLMLTGFFTSTSSDDILLRIALLIGGMGFGSMCIWLIIALPYIIIASVRFRKTVRTLEQEIDESLSQNADPFDLNKNVQQDPFEEEPKVND